MALDAFDIFLQCTQIICKGVYTFMGKVNTPVYTLKFGNEKFWLSRQNRVLEVGNRQASKVTPRGVTLDASFRWLNQIWMLHINFQLSSCHQYYKQFLGHQSCIKLLTSHVRGIKGRTNQASKATPAWWKNLYKSQWQNSENMESKWCVHSKTV